jgi:excisionase family DNA binding protein
MPELKTIEIANGLMDVAALSAYLGIPTSTIYSLTMKATIPHYHIGKLLRFRKNDIDTWLENSGCDGSGLER